MWEKTYEVLKEYAEELKSTLVESYLSDDRKATEELINSVRNNSLDFMVKKDDRQIEVRIRLEEYWKYVEYDLPPRWPPVDKIREWVTAKPILPNADSRGKLPTPDQLAFLIGRSMAGLSPHQSETKNPQGGTKGTHNLEDTLKELNQLYEEKILQAVSDDLDKELDIILTEYMSD